MKKEVKTFEEIVHRFAAEKGLKWSDYSILKEIDVVEFYIDRHYFISVGRYDGGLYEVYEIAHGAQTDEEGYITDGELWQYKLYKNLKSALNFALKCREERTLPAKPLASW